MFTEQRLKAGLAGCGLLLFSLCAHAQQFPSRPVTVYSGFGPQSPPEIELRVMTPFLTKQWGQPLVIEAKLGAGGLLALEAASRAAPDGHTLSIGVAAVPTYKLLVKDLHFDPSTDLEPISIYADYPGGFWTNDKVPARTIEEFIAYAKANAGKLNYASVGRSTTVFTIERLKALTGMQLTWVPHKAFPDAFTSLVRNDTQLFNNTSSATDKALVAQGIHPLLTIGDKRAPAFPDVPTSAEKGWYIPRNGWYALFAPKGTPKTATERIAADIALYAQTPEAKKRADELGIRLLATTPDELRQQIERDGKTWAEIAQKNGIQPE